MVALRTFGWLVVLLRPTSIVRALPCHHGGPCPPISQHLLPRLHNTPSCLQTEGPHDMAATITLPHPDGGVVHHVFQFCIPCIDTSPQSTCYWNTSSHSNPNSANGTWAVNNVGDAWQHATSRDLVRWENHGNQIGVYSGFLLPSENGTVCAGQRCGNVWCPGHPSCGDPRQTNCPGLIINGSGPLNGTTVDMVPVFLTCATDSTLSRWSGHSYPFNPREYRGMAFDPQAWKDEDGMYYIAVATDGCNSTTRKLPCIDGMSMYLWRAPRLLAPSHEWEALGPMFNSRDDAMLKNASRGEMVTPSFTGNLHGDPRRGRTRLLTNNVCTGTSYYLGTQANGSRFLDRNGLWRFDGPGEQGMIDWGAIVVNQTAVALGKTGTDALATSMQMVPGTCHAPYSMPRVLGDPSGQTVATGGRKIMIGWIGNGTFASQSLPRELSLSPLSGALIQRWVPELRTLRVSGAIGGGFQTEIFARMLVSRSAEGLPRRFGVRVLVGPSGEGTDIGVDMDSRIVFIDGRNSGSCDAIPWQCGAHTPSGQKGLYPAGPLLGNSSVIEVHCYVDAVYVSCIFNNQTAITAMVAPSARAIDPATTFGSGAIVQLQTWRLSVDTGSKALVPDQIAQEVGEQPLPHL